MSVAARMSLIAVLLAAGAGTALPAAAAAPAPATRARVERISTDSDGGQLPSASQAGAVSADGRYAVFLSRDPGGGEDRILRLKDLRTGALTRIPESLVYTQVTGLSADGRRIAYSDGNRYPMPYVHDRATGRTTQLWPARPPEDGSYELGQTAAISADGRRVAYTLGNRHGLEFASVLYVRDLASGADEQIVRLSPDAMVVGASLDAKGRSVAYGVSASTGDGMVGQVYVEDRVTGVTRRVDTGVSARLVQLSADGRRVLFTVRSEDGTSASYVRDLRTDRVRRIAGATALAADGALRFVVLTEGDTLVLRDLRTGRQRAVAPAEGDAVLPGSVSRHGDAVFTSSAAGLVQGDTNGVPDVFVARPHR
ncbi:TolB family protein [Streptomyces sp. NPDC090108]|uniref:TolB family protein n=1 Tax=Streptomyces sp. NPDC090108 TaxID=3365947 RepID=UPI003811CEF1